MSDRHEFLALTLTNASCTDLNECRNITDRILANPQAHIDALCEAGVLEKRYGQTEPDRVLPGGTTVMSTGPLYRVQPHKHDPYVQEILYTEGVVILRCKSDRCQWSPSVPNRLPIEVPSD